MTNNVTSINEQDRIANAFPHSTDSPTAAPQPLEIGSNAIGELQVSTDTPTPTPSPVAISPTTTSSPTNTVQRETSFFQNVGIFFGNSFPTFRKIFDEFLPNIQSIFEYKIPTNFQWKYLLDFIWYVFIMLLLGQLGVVLALGIAMWEGTSIQLAISQQANNGNFLTFAVALLAGSGFFMIREFHGGSGVATPLFKSPVLLLSIIAGFAGSLVSAALTKSTQTSMTSSQELLHWGLYIACVILSIVWWLIEEFQGSTKDLAKEVNKNSKELTEKSKTKAPQTSAKNGLKV